LREDAKTAVRQVRREANDEIKKAEKAGDTSEDESHRDQAEVQKITDKHTDKIDEICKAKEKELLEV
jgi:ribosome recycling factor